MKQTLTIQKGTIAAQTGMNVKRALRKAFLPNYLIVIIVAGAMVLPFIWMVLTSFKVSGEILALPPLFFPKIWTLKNFLNVFSQLDMAQLYWNTTYVTGIRCFTEIYLAALLGYVFGKYHFKGRDLAFYFILATMILPFEVYVIPLYRMMVGLKLGNNHLALIIPMLYSAYATFMMRQFMFTIPDELIDAARIDGAGEMVIFHRIVIPLCKPILATLTGVYFMWNWNDFLWPLIVITDRKLQLLPVALASFVADHGIDYGLIMAGATLSVIPVLIVFFAFQRYVVQGINLSGIK